MKHEKQLVNQILELKDGFTINEVRHLAFQTAKKKKIANNFSNTKQMAGKGWYYSFLKRNPALAERQH
jgi:hypothetical protein